MRLLTAATALTLFASATLAETVTTPPFIEAVYPMNGEVFGVAIGPGGPSVEFSSAETNGGLYRLGRITVHIPMSDGKGLRNPTGMTVSDGMIYLVDGNEILAVTPEGDVRWRVVDGRISSRFGPTSGRTSASAKSPIGSPRLCTFPRRATAWSWKARSATRSAS